MQFSTFEDEKRVNAGPIGYLYEYILDYTKYPVGHTVFSVPQIL
jgi:hypothetical protein